MEHKCKKTDLKTVEKCELKRDEIIKALECCGTSDKSCSYCPLAKDYSPCSKTMAENALSLIKELTEENERLRAYNENLINANTYLSNHLLDEVEQAKDLAISDTVREYREKLYRAFAHSDSKDKFNKGVFLTKADQIAKEMVEAAYE